MLPQGSRPATPEEVKAIQSQQGLVGQSAITKDVTLPAQQATQGNLDIQKTQQTLPAQVNSINANSNVDVNTAPAKITSANANATVDVNQQNKIDQLASTGAYFEAHKGKDKKVSPADYNQELSKYVGLGGSSDEFNQKFSDKYVNPNNVWYDTPDNIAIRKSIPQIVETVKHWATLPHTGPDAPSMIDSIPFASPTFKNLLTQKLLGPEIAYNSNKASTAGGFLPTQGAGAASTVRGSSAELANVVNGLPDAFDGDQTAEEKIKEQNDYLRQRFGTDLYEWGLPKPKD